MDIKSTGFWRSMLPPFTTSVCQNTSSLQVCTADEPRVVHNVYK